MLHLAYLLVYHIYKSIRELNWSFSGIPATHFEQHLKYFLPVSYMLL